MACSTCDDYCYIPEAEGGELIECPDCHAGAIRAWCPVHSLRLNAEGLCRRCVTEAARGRAVLAARALHERARQVAAAAAAAEATT